MVLAPDEERANRIKVLALHGISKDAWKRFGDEGYKHYYVTECGFKYNMMDIQAAMGIHQLHSLEENWLRRESVWNTYREVLRDLPLVLPSDPAEGTRHGYHLYTVQIDAEGAGISRDDFLSAMTAEGIGVGVHYQSIPSHPYYNERFGWRPEDYPNALAIGERTVSLPLTPALEEGDVEDVVGAVRVILEKGSL